MCVFVEPFRWPLRGAVEVRWWSGWGDCGTAGSVLGRVVGVSPVVRLPNAGGILKRVETAQRIEIDRDRNASRSLFV
jgi:hypothetical protein